MSNSVEDETNRASLRWISSFMYDREAKRDGSYLSSVEDIRIPLGIRIQTLKSGRVSYKRWFLPLSYGHLTLREAYDYLQIVGAPQGKIPEVIRWTEGKDSHLVKQFFYGGVDLRAHDFIHILLGRGLLPKDEAFVIGFTMGSTNRLNSMNEDAFAYIAKHHYPNAYRMDDDSRSVFLDASKLGYISDCRPLDEVDFTPFLDMTVDEVRARLNLKTRLLEAYYREVEQAKFPEDPASRRLLPRQRWEDPWRLDSGDGERSLESAAAEINQLLDTSDQTFELDEAVFEELLERSYAGIAAHVEEQSEIARHCFEEIARVLGGEDEQANRDVAEGRWEDFGRVAKENVDKARNVVRRDVRYSFWEGRVEEGKELRTWVHALLGRGDSPRDRAFCLGFYDGSTNRRTTYASELKLGMLQETWISRDGLYSDDMDQVYHDGARLGYISLCEPLGEVDFESLRELPVSEARRRIGLKMGLLEAYRVDVEDRRMLL